MIRATKIYFLGKALRTLPEKFHGITNIDSCYRQRYLELFGKAQIAIADKVIDFAGKWRIVTFRDVIYQDCSIDINLYDSAEKLLAEIERMGIKLESEIDISKLGRGNLIDL